MGPSAKCPKSSRERQWTVLMAPSSSSSAGATGAVACAAWLATARQALAASFCSKAGAQPCTAGLRVGGASTALPGHIRHLDHMLLDRTHVWPAARPDVTLQLGRRLVSKRTSQFLEWAAAPTSDGRHGCARLSVAFLSQPQFVVWCAHIRVVCSVYYTMLWCGTAARWSISQAAL